jgi:CubicO group peptidase (beta-lactamase class C family)
MTRRQERSLGRRTLLATAVGVLATAAFADTSLAQDSIETRIGALAPRLEAYITNGMKAFDNPGLAIGIVADGRLVYAKGFGVRKKGGAPVDTRTVFQIGSATKGFLATTMAIAVDRKKLSWDDRIVDLDPDFQLKDPWVTREFRLFDIIAQRSGLPTYVNDAVGMLGYSEADMIRSLRYVDPVTSFRATFTYTNITHLEAGRIVAKAEGAPDWEAVVAKDIFGPLGMNESSVSAAAIEAAPNHAQGHRWSAAGTVEVPFTQLFPYLFAGAGAINSTIEDMAKWLRLQLADGTFEGKRIVSRENLAVTRMPRVALSDKLAYAMGWVVAATPNGTVVWHNGGTPSFGAYVGLAVDKGFGVVVLTNEANVGFPDAVGIWTLDRLLGNPDVDHVAVRLKLAREQNEKETKQFAKPANPRPVPPLGPLAGTYTHPFLGKTTIRADNGVLTMELPTGAALRFDPWDGDVFTVSVLPAGQFKALADNLGPTPLAFAQFQMGKEGTLDLLRLTTSDGQSYELRRE